MKHQVTLIRSNQIPHADTSSLGITAYLIIPLFFSVLGFVLFLLTEQHAAQLGERFVFAQKVKRRRRAYWEQDFHSFLFPLPKEESTFTWLIKQQTQRRCVMTSWQRTKTAAGSETEQNRVKNKFTGKCDMSLEAHCTVDLSREGTEESGNLDK